MIPPVRCVTLCINRREMLECVVDSIRRTTVKETYELVLVNHAAGIVSGCKVCRQILRRGTWAVGVKIGDHHYVVGENPKRECCGEEKNVIQAFDSQAEADALAEDVREQLNREGTTENLALHELMDGSTVIKIAPVH